MRNKPATASVILANTRGDIFLQLRDNIAGILYPGHWSIFGGYLENNETPQQAAVRELKEELNLDIPSEKLLFFKTYTLAERIDHFFIYRADLDLAALTLREGQDMRYFSKEIIFAQKLGFYDDQVLRDFFALTSASETRT